MNFWEKLRNLPEFQKKLILWCVVGVVALTLFILWVINVKKNLQVFQPEELKKQFQFPEIPELKLPELNISQPSEEELKQIEEQLKLEEQLEQKENGKQ